MSVPRRGVRRAYAALLLITVSCVGPTDPPLPRTAQRFVPPPVYTRWWQMTEQCSGLTGSLDDLSWFEVPEELAFKRDGQWVSAYWSAGSSQIVIAGDLKLDGPTVRHEMAHALARKSGHSRELYLRACGGVVACGVGCIADGEPPPPPDPLAVVVAPASLVVEVEVFPEKPSTVAGDGVLTLTVRVRNPADHPVTVQLPTSNGFYYEIRGEGEDFIGRLKALDPELTVFAAGETKRQVFDFIIAVDGRGPGLWRGHYVLGGSYGQNFASVPVVIE